MRKCHTNTRDVEVCNTHPAQGSAQSGVRNHCGLQKSEVSHRGKF